MSPVAEAWLLQSAVMFLILGSLAGVLVGLALLYAPHHLQRVSVYLNRWISTRQLNQPWERHISIEPVIYRYHKTSGVFIMLGALYIVYYFFVSMDRLQVVKVLAESFRLHAVLIGGLLDGVVLIGLLGSFAAIMAGLFLLLRPSQLRNFEQGANRWVSLRRTLKPVEITRAGVDEFVYRQGRKAGVAILLGSLYTLVMLLSWLVKTQ